MERQHLMRSVQVNTIKSRVQILDTPLELAQYDKVIQLPAPRADNTFYKTMLHVDGIDINERKVKQRVVDIFESPIWRAKIPGIVHSIQHEAIRNIIFLGDNQQDPHNALLIAKYEYETSDIQSRVDEQPALIGINRVAYLLGVTRRIYQASGFTFSGTPASNLKHTQIVVAMT